MEVLNWKEREDVKVEKFPYRGEMYDVKGISVRWQSRTGEVDVGQPEYGLRFFTAQTGGAIPIHNHFYVQTMYILSGTFECWSADPETNEKVYQKTCGPGEAIYVPSMEPHGMQNISETEEGAFLCCICNVYEEDML